MRKNVVKKVTAVTLAATLAFGSLISAFADLGITGGTGTYGIAGASASASASANPSQTPTTKPSQTPTTTPTGKPSDIIFENGNVVDGTSGWNSQGGGEIQLVDGYYTNVYFTNEPFIRDKDNWSNFVIETNSVDGVKGVTLRADNFGWTYNDSATVEPTIGKDDMTWTDWAKFQEFCKGEVIVSATKADANTLKFIIQFSSGDKETYTITYPNGIPTGLVFYVGADGGKITQNKITFTEELPKIEVVEPTTSPTTKPTTKPTTSPTKKPSVTKPVVPAKLTVKETAGYDKATSYTLVKGKKVVIATSISPAKASQKIKATVNKKKVATAKVKGSKVTITAKAVGTAKVTIASTAKASVKKVVTVKVVKKAVKAKKVTVKKATLTIKKGKTGQINIKKITPSNTTDKVTYKVTKKLKGVSVDKFGKVKVAKKAKKGTAVVTVKVGKKASKKVTIKVK